MNIEISGVIVTKNLSSEEYLTIIGSNKRCRTVKSIQIGLIEQISTLFSVQPVKTSTKCI